MGEYTYQDYLNDWEDRFGAVESAMYFYWLRGRKIEKPIHRLTELQWQKHLGALEMATAEFEKAKAEDDGDGMDRALEQSFPYEWALLF